MLLSELRARLPLFEAEKDNEKKADLTTSPEEQSHSSDKGTTQEKVP